MLLSKNRENQTNIHPNNESKNKEKKEYTTTKHDRCDNFAYVNEVLVYTLQSALLQSIIIDVNIAYVNEVLVYTTPRNY